MGKIFALALAALLLASLATVAGFPYITTALADDDPEPGPTPPPPPPPDGE